MGKQIQNQKLINIQCNTQQPPLVLYLAFWTLTGQTQAQILSITFHLSSFFPNSAPSVGLMSQLTILAPQKASDSQSISTVEQSIYTVKLFMTWFHELQLFINWTNQLI